MGIIRILQLGDPRINAENVDIFQKFIESRDLDWLRGHIDYVVACGSITANGAEREDDFPHARAFFGNLSNLFLTRKRDCIGT